MGNIRKSKNRRHIYSSGGFAKFLNTTGDKLFGQNSETMFGLTKGGTQLANLGIGAASLVASGLINHNGLSTGVGDTFSTVGSLASNIPGIGGVIGAGVGALGSVINAGFGSKINKEFVNLTNTNIGDLMAINFDNSSVDNLELGWNNMTMLDNVSRKLVGKDGWFRSKAKRKARKLNRLIDWANEYALDTFDNSSSNLVTNNLLNQLANFAAKGGPLNTNDYEYKPEDLPILQRYVMESGKTFPNVLVKSKGAQGDKINKILKGERLYKLAFGGSLKNMKNNIFDMGGEIFGPSIGGPSHGSDFKNGVTKIKEGGTHEENPIQGIPFGMDLEGVPNLVEEGEVIFNDYVYSNRIIADKESIENTNLDKKYIGKSYAYIAEELSKESEERPNDPISISGLNANMGKLMAAQELQKHKEEMDQMNEMFDLMQNLNEEEATELADELGMSGQEEMPQEMPQEDMGQYDMEEMPQQEVMDPISMQGFAFGGNLFSGGGDTLPNITMPKDIAVGGEVPMVTSLDAFQAPIPGSMYINGRMKSAPNKVDPKGGNNSKNMGWLANARYAPILGSLGQVTQDIFSKPDYSAVDRIDKAIKPIPKVLAQRMNNYMTHNPLDESYYLNRLDQLQAGTRSALRNSSGGNRATMGASLLAADSQLGSRRGELYRQGLDYNQLGRQRAAEFNRGVDQYNSDSAMRAASANASAQLALNQLRLGAYTTQAQLRDQIDTKMSAAKSNNYSNLFSQIGALGKEELSRNMIAGNDSLGYYLSRLGETMYKGKKDK